MSNGEDVDILDDENEYERDVDGCLHGVPWCEDCPFCQDEEDEADFA